VLRIRESGTKGCRIVDCSSCVGGMVSIIKVWDYQALYLIVVRLVLLVVSSGISIWWSADFMGVQTDLLGNFILIRCKSIRLAILALDGRRMCKI
jgi:hypothetical protein